MREIWIAAVEQGEYIQYKRENPGLSRYNKGDLYSRNERNSNYCGRIKEIYTIKNRKT